jgi:hypothetical protein
MKVFYNFSINHILVLLVLLGSDGCYTRNLEEKKIMFGPLLFICLSLLKFKFLYLLYIDLIMEITQIYGGHCFSIKKSLKY